MRNLRAVGVLGLDPDDENGNVGKGGGKRDCKRKSTGTKQ